jgi:hypothetical protein
VYIQEAHPTDGWQVGINVAEGVTFTQPQSASERESVADACALELALSIPTVIDDMDNSTDDAYAAVPDRLYLVGKDGRIAYKGGPGPFAFRPDEFEAAISAYLA